MRVEDNVSGSKDIPSVSERKDAGAAPDPKKVDEFNKALAGEEVDGKDSSKSGQGKDGKSGMMGFAFSGQQDLSSIFSSLNEQTAVSDTTNVAATSSVSMTSTEIYDLASKLVDKIMVSADNGIDGTRQVMLHVNQSILVDTDITLTRETNGMLMIAISSSDAISYRKLQETTQILEQSLAEHEIGQFRVDVRYTGANSDGNSYAQAQQSDDEMSDIV